jgi:hypothetical protein
MTHEKVEEVEEVEKVDLTAVDAGTSKEAAPLPDEHGDSAEPRATSLDSALPPADGGKAAWLFLAACWMIEALVFGECMRAHSRPCRSIFQAEVGVMRLWLFLRHLPGLSEQTRAVRRFRKDRRDRNDDNGEPTAVRCVSFAAEADADTRELSTWARRWSLHFVVSFRVGLHTSRSWASSLLPLPC